MRHKFGTELQKLTKIANKKIWMKLKIWKKSRK